jgi:hypothetical protein
VRWRSLDKNEGRFEKRVEISGRMLEEGMEEREPGRVSCNWWRKLRESSSPKVCKNGFCGEVMWRRMLGKEEPGQA